MRTISFDFEEIETVLGLPLDPSPEWSAWVDSFEWGHRGLCRGVNPDLFYPERGVSSREAKAVCQECPVRLECLEYGTTRVEKFGVWGGRSEKERRRIRKERRLHAGLSEEEPWTPEDDYREELEFD